MAIGAARAARPPGEVGRDPLGEPDRDAARPRPGAVPASSGSRATARIVGLRCRVVGDAGAYAGFGGTLALGPTRMMAQGVYRIPKIGYDVAVALTNTTPMGAYRGAGRPEAAAMLERIIDMAAAELGIDPVELRRRNFLQPDEFPYTTVTGATYDSGDYDAALARRCASPATTSCAPSRRRAASAATASQLGIGVASTSRSPRAAAAASTPRSRCTPTARATIKAGTSAHGQGHATVVRA